MDWLICEYLRLPKAKDPMNFQEQRNVIQHLFNCSRVCNFDEEKREMDTPILWNGTKRTHGKRQLLDLRDEKNPIHLPE